MLRLYNMRLYVLCLKNTLMDFRWIDHNNPVHMIGNDDEFTLWNSGKMNWKSLNAIEAQSYQREINASLHRVYLQKNGKRYPAYITAKYNPGAAKSQPFMRMDAMRYMFVDLPSIRFISIFIGELIAHHWSHWSKCILPILLPNSLNDSTHGCIHAMF